MSQQKSNKDGGFPSNLFSTDSGAMQGLGDGMMDAVRDEHKENRMRQKQEKDKGKTQDNGGKMKDK